MATVSTQIESVPGFDEINDIWNDYAGNKFNLKDPFYVELPNGKTKRRRPPETLSNPQRKVWKRIISKAWFHDRCFLNIRGMDIGLGMCPLVDLIPVIGPMLMWTMHGRILRIADDLNVPASVQAKISANIFFDFLCSLIPVLGSLFAWMNACSTRNAALIDSYLRTRETRLDELSGPYERVVPDATTKSKKMPNGNRAIGGSAQYNSGRVGQQQSGYL